MKTTINEHQFANEMTKEEHGFSYEGAKALFNYLGKLEQDCNTGKEMEFQPAFLRYMYAEYESFEELQQDYSEIENIETLKNKIVIQIPNSEGIIIQQF